MEKENSVWQGISSKVIYYLRLNGYGAASLNTSGKEGNWDTEKICVTKDGRDLCDINCIEGTITYLNASDQEEIDSIRDFINDLQEQERIFTRAEPMQVEGLKHHKVLVEYNNVILTACESESLNSSMQKVNSYQYVTWEKDRGGLQLGVHSGNYFSDNYTCAKENFAVRAGILRKSKLLSETEMMAIYSGIIKLEDNENNIDGSNKIFKQIKQKIQDIIPDIEARIYRNDPRFITSSVNETVVLEEDLELYEQELQ
ncbi:hypothetical protein [Ruminiclostridium cellulolyticum]|uniref:Uncharacterized protein n=1 Tax=Ruminiclostridium cellulolyticum (strain ATCC 35319 / DSM 5812 / JCM 6584 / H10) TaxID=394503 RepID=B8I0E3_RUMCH|nr:hypothetical protein [Ruminiclostridium cellulolyticum]ACL77469.1 hypothetical protein Ccel_3178 [Ruminiclostridium cellulolyticum H10]